MSRKPKANYRKADGTEITFRESLSFFAPNNEEFSKLKNKIIEIIGIETSTGFDDKLHFLITLLRSKTYIHTNNESVTITQKKLSGLQNHLTKLQKYMSTEISDMTWQHLNLQKVGLMSERDIEDPIFDLQINIQIALDLCERTRNEIKGKKPEFTPMDMRQVLAEELARELDTMGIDLKKYRNGEFVTILRHVLKAVSCKVNRQRISISIPNDLFDVASKAIDEFPTKKPHTLLNFA